MFKTIIKKLYFKYYGEPDVVAMTRTQLMGVPMTPEVLDLPLPEQKQIAEEAQMILSSEVFKLAVNSVKNRLLKHIQNEAATADIIFLDRFSINGADMVKEELESYAGFEIDSHEEFDKHDVF